ncbi:MAG TPA: hypothetical protein VFS09_11315 [Candidatus Eisenbacteria bacterium]|nr:hypothetical protein [Candidatus Eisenbacteria bacterium]
MKEPREFVESMEANPVMPAGEGERFAVYAVMACPFESGDILCNRRIPASSIGPAYTSIWHRDPEGRWRFHQDAPPMQSCPRFFGSALTEVTESDVEWLWTGPRSFRIVVPGRIEWEVSLAPSAGTRALSAIGGLLPDGLWRSPAVLGVLESIAGSVLGAGKLALAGRASNGQNYIANPQRIWTISSSRATVDGRDLGSVRTLPTQARLGDFWVPRTGLFAIGRSFFDAFDPARHAAFAYEGV